MCKRRKTIWLWRGRVIKKPLTAVQIIAANEVLFGSYQRMFTDIENYTKVSPEDVKNVSGQIFKFESTNFIESSP